MKEYINWKQINEYVGDLVTKIDQKNYKNIFGIPRGGLIPAVMLSYELEIPLINRINDITDKTLIVDDISDTGNTLISLIKKLDFKPDIATIHYHNNTKVVPNYTLIEKTDNWIVYPWEAKAKGKEVVDGTFRFF
jgi:hypoxanthine phosphoribosyltransferase|tara:strand:- start:8789 stop:9193 length:405 start_codon:yes stop_codon:yes gene_type:complete